MRHAALAALLAIAAAGCDRSETSKVTPASRDLGTGLNTVQRSYSRSPEEMAPLVRRTLEALELKVSSEKMDHLGGELIAQRATGQKVTATIRGVETVRCTLSIRVEPGDRDLANVIHDRIAQDTPILQEKPGQP